MDLSNIFFINPSYLVSLVILAIALGWYSRLTSLVKANVLFFIFAADQLFFRVIDDSPGAQPLRLVGQMIYFGLFLVIMLVMDKLRERG